MNHIVIFRVSVVLSSKLEGNEKNETLLFACMLHYSIGNFFSKKFGIFGGVGVTTNGTVEVLCALLLNFGIFGGVGVTHTDVPCSFLVAC